MLDGLATKVQVQADGPAEAGRKLEALYGKNAFHGGTAFAYRV
jgi:hypothetical protein